MVLLTSPPGTPRGVHQDTPRGPGDTQRTPQVTPRGAGLGACLGICLGDTFGAHINMIWNPELIGGGGRRSPLPKTDPPSSPPDRPSGGPLGCPLGVPWSVPGGCPGTTPRDPPGGPWGGTLGGTPGGSPWVLIKSTISPKPLCTVGLPWSPQGLRWRSPRVQGRRG
jgi:hypothetical protein